MELERTNCWLKQGWHLDYSTVASWTVRTTSGMMGVELRAGSNAGFTSDLYGWSSWTAEVDERARWPTNARDLVREGIDKLHEGDTSLGIYGHRTSCSRRERHCWLISTGPARLVRRDTPLVFREVWNGQMIQHSWSNRLSPLTTTFSCLRGSFLSGRL
jgi:hypothetical protein